MQETLTFFSSTEQTRQEAGFLERILAPAPKAGHGSLRPEP